MRYGGSKKNSRYVNKLLFYKFRAMIEVVL